MSADLHGQLSFGYDLGTREEGFVFTDDTAPAWTRERDAIGAAEELLLASVGFTEDGIDGAEGSRFDRRRRAQFQLGVEIKMYGSDRYARWMLVGLHVQSAGIGPTEVTEADLLVSEMRLEQLRHAAQVLGVTGTPRWMLTGIYF